MAVNVISLLLSDQRISIRQHTA